MVRNKYCQLTIMAICLLCLSSCASPYIGRSVNTNHEAWCSFRSLPASCSNSDKAMTFEYQIEETGEAGEYQLTGTADNVMGGQFDHYYQLNFNLLLVHNSIVVESIGFGSNNGLSHEHVTFSKTFTTPYDFEASAIDYSFTYR